MPFDHTEKEEEIEIEQSVLLILKKMASFQFKKCQSKRVSKLFWSFFKRTIMMLILNRIIIFRTFYSHKEKANPANQGFDYLYIYCRVEPVREQFNGFYTTLFIFRESGRRASIIMQHAYLFRNKITALVIVRSVWRLFRAQMTRIRYLIGLNFIFTFCFVL